MRDPVAIVALLGVGLFSSGALAAPQAGEPGVHRMKKVQLVDQHGFERPLPAITMLIPVGWKFEGDVLYPKGTGCGDFFKLSFRAQSPDGRTAIELFPAYAWQWADDPGLRQQMVARNQQNARFGQVGCDVMAPMHAADFVTRLMAPKVRPGARVLGAEPMPDTEKPLQQQIQQAQQQANQVGLRVRISGDHARAHVAYDLKGAPVEEWLTAVVTVRASQLPVFSGGRMVQSTSYQASARMLFSLRAPKGELEANRQLYELIISTMRIEPEWQARVGQVQGNIAAINQQGAADRARIIAKSAEDQRNIRSEMYEHQQHAQDVQHQQFSQYVRDVETYRDPNSGERVELPNRYGHAWSNGNGEYILSESPGFNPNAKLDGTWTQLHQVKPE